MDHSWSIHALLTPGVAALGVVIALAAGCVTTKERGDHAFESHQYSRALDQYEIAIDNGSRDPQLYFNAAKAAAHVGDFSLAERYYSRALRYGGSNAVKRSLADFYISTSNYTKAVGVLQDLLETTDAEQSVYNNLGTALMYGQAPLDAESYLLIAQQMRPADPVPYVNLAVLYDKYLHQPRLAMGFYQCFLAMSDDAGQTPKIKARLERLQRRYGKDRGRQFEVACGKSYQPAPPPSKQQLREAMRPDADDTDQPEAGQSSAADDQKSARPTPDNQSGDDSEPTAQDGEPAAPPVAIYRPPERSSAADEASDDHEDDSKKLEHTIDQAQRAYADHNYGQAVQALDGLPAASLDGAAMALYGRALVEVGEYKRARRWLAGVVEDHPNPENVSALMEVYRQLGDTDKLVDLCDQLSDVEPLEDVLKACPEQQLRDRLEETR